MMISLKSINPSFTLTNIKCNIYIKRSSTLCLCKFNESDSQASQPGDTKKQELLVRMAMLQARKIRLTDYLDERSAYLTQFGEKVIAEFEKIGEDALTGLDEASARIIANMESQMLEIEKSAEINRQKIQECENELQEFEVQMENGRNEGLFFKNLRKKVPVVDKAKAKDEAEKIIDVTREKAGSKIRKNVYQFFIGLLTITVVYSISLPSTDWRKVAVFGAILVALISQFTYEQNMSAETKTTRKDQQ